MYCLLSNPFVGVVATILKRMRTAWILHFQASWDITEQLHLKTQFQDNYTVAKQDSVDTPASRLYRMTLSFIVTFVFQ